EHRIDDGPRSLHHVLPSKERGIAFHGVTKQALIGLHAPALALGALFDHSELYGNAVHAIAWALGVGAQVDPHIGAQPEADVVLDRHRFLKDYRRRSVELDHDLGDGL